MWVNTRAGGNMKDIFKRRKCKQYLREVKRGRRKRTEREDSNWWHWTGSYKPNKQSPLTCSFLYLDLYLQQWLVFHLWQWKALNASKGTRKYTKHQWRWLLQIQTIPLLLCTWTSWTLKGSIWMQILASIAVATNEASKHLSISDSPKCKLYSF